MGEEPADASSVELNVGTWDVKGADGGLPSET